MNSIRLGIIGLGTSGGSYARFLLSGQVPRLSLAAVCDTDPVKLEPFRELQRFEAPRALLEWGGIDAVIIATPHFDHTPLGIAALEAGLHVLMEKPIAVHKAEAERLLATYRGRGKQVFAAMFNQRTDESYRKIRALVQDGELGEIRRVNWIITDWFRPDAYYGMSRWRATWAGEGGGVLLNQCPHNLDLFQWLFGLPCRVRAHCGFGRYHDIEVEDDVTAYFEFPGGATGVLITSTGEAPGTNRLEIAAENGRVVLEDNRIVFKRNEVPVGEFSRTSAEPFAAPATREVSFAFEGHGEQHVGIMRNFADAILEGARLIAPAVEGVCSVELANAMLLSAWTDTAVDLPLDAALYARELEVRMAQSRYHQSAPRPEDTKPGNRAP